MKMLHHQFIKTAKKYSKKLAIVDKTTNKSLTYSKALIASLILADKLKKYDKGFIGIMIPTSAGSILSVLASLLSGRVPVMINYSTGAEKNCIYAQERCDFKIIITSKALLQKINCNEVEGMVFIEDIMKSISIIDKINFAFRSQLPTKLLISLVHKGNEDDNAIILFTSGSEKDPKAVQLSHKNFNANLHSLTQAYSLNSNDIFLANLPLFHVFGQIAHLWIPLNEGMTIVTYANPIEYRKMCEIIRDEKVTIFVGTPSFLLGYLEKSKTGDFDSCRLIIAGADKTPLSLHGAYLEKHNKVIFEAYGATETSPGLSANNVQFNKPGSCGKPLNGVTFFIENYETGKECAVDEIGKILVKGDNVMKGYFDDFEQTSIALRHGWYDTGDMGYIDIDGFVWHSGRLKRFVKIGGEMVSLVKVENVLESILPVDIKCCIVELPDQSKGAKIIAAITQEIDTKAILQKMSEQLPNIFLPKQFVVIEDLPQMGSGKIDFKTTTELVKNLLKH
jgi:acyl-[acyl-carrier-protein]-phospholipid O-acyltransferase/long-chain-fatty-acid--[acyl-carrier-protein] ligase